MTYLKLCQIFSESVKNEEGLYTQVDYLETCDGTVSVFNITIPCEIKCEIIKWSSEEGFITKSETVSIISETVILSAISGTIRQTVYNKLIEKYPNLVI